MQITEEQNKELEQIGFFQLKISKYPTWANAQIQNGIEIRFNEIKTFKVEMGERKYEGVIEDVTKMAVNILKKTKEEPKPEDSQEIEDVGRASEQTPTVQTKEVIGILPDFFTEVLMTKWKALPGIRRLLDVQHTPPHQIYRVEVGRDSGRPIMTSYVKGNYMITEANYVFLFDWNYDVVDVSISETGVSVRGVFVGTLDGKVMKKSSVGYQERNKKMDAQQAQKSALTDAIKKALSYMGFNRDVYGGEI